MIHSSHQEIREFNRHSFDYLVKFQLYANFNSTALHTKQPKNLTESVSFYHHLKKNIYIHNTPKQNSFLLKIAKFSSSLFHQTWVGKKKKKKIKKSPLQTQAMPLCELRPCFFQYLGLADWGKKKLGTGRMCVFEMAV